MRSLAAVIAAAAMLGMAGASLAQGVNSNVGPGGAAVTPRGISFKDPDAPLPFPSQDPRARLQMEIPLAKNILLGAKSVSNAAAFDEDSALYARALASLIYAQNQPLAKKTLEELAGSAGAAARLYGIIGVQYALGTRKAAELAGALDPDEKINVIYNGIPHEADVKKFLEVFFKNPKEFVPRREILD